MDELRPSETSTTFFTVRLRTNNGEQMKPQSVVPIELAIPNDDGKAHNKLSIRHKKDETVIYEPVSGAQLCCSENGCPGFSVGPTWSPHVQFQRTSSRSTSEECVRCELAH